MDSILRPGWCDYLVCDPMACPPELSASELWRMKQVRGGSVGSGSSSDEILFDLDADPDPEQETVEWV